MLRQIVVGVLYVVFTMAALAQEKPRDPFNPQKDTRVTSESAGTARDESDDFVLRSLDLPDDRQDLNDVKSFDVLRNATATVALIKKTSMERTVRGRYELDVKTLKAKKKLCDGEKFEKQWTVAWCTGFLISRDEVITAAHCVDDDPDGKPEIGNLRVVFGWEYPKVGTLTRYINQHQIYDIDWKKSVTGGPASDWARLKLTRPVPEFQMLPQIAAASVTVGAGVYVLGFPSGLPMKYAANAAVIDGETLTATEFQANLDTFHGNSGSPVFNASHEIVGILVGGKSDYTESPKTPGCYLTAVCNPCGETVLKISAIKGASKPIVP